MTVVQGLWSLSKAGNTEDCPVGARAVGETQLGDAAQGVRRQGKIPWLPLPQTANLPPKTSRWPMRSLQTWSLGSAACRSQPLCNSEQSQGRAAQGSEGKED